MIFTQSEYKRVWLAAVLWPSFMGALLLSFIVFLLVDPEQITFLGYLQLSRATVYTLGFFLFWLIGVLISWLAVKIAPETFQEDDF